MLTDDPAAVSVTALTKTFGNRTVLRGIDLDVAAGSIAAVLGPSGCGKTTLLRLLAGFEGPDSGVIRIGGEVMNTVPAHRRRVGLMPQEGALFPHLSVGENITFGRGRARRAATAAVAGHWLEVVGLDGLAAARPHQLSGGQQQRVALARALAAEPRVLLLDEPFAALDAGLRERVREDIAAILRQAGTTALLVTHDQAEALSLADSVALLMDGVVAQHGPPAQLYRRPASLAAARFVGATVEMAGTCDGSTVRTALGTHPCAGPAPAGDVVAVLRPEQIRIVGTCAPGNPGAATVTASRFYGSETTVHVHLADGAKLSLRTSGDVAPAIGTEVALDITGEVLAYPSPAAGQRVALGEAGS